MKIFIEGTLEIDLSAGNKVLTTAECYNKYLVEMLGVLLMQLLHQIKDGTIL